MLVFSGICLIILGLFFIFRDQIPWLKSLGRLPGDIAIEKENFRFYFPLTTSILLSLIFTLIAYLLRR